MKINFQEFLASLILEKGNNMKKRPTKKQMNQVIKNSADKIKKQGGSPSEISNKRKTSKKVYKDVTKELRKLSKQFGKNK